MLNQSPSIRIAVDRPRIRLSSVSDARRRPLMNLPRLEYEDLELPDVVPTPPVRRTRRRLVVALVALAAIGCARTLGGSGRFGRLLDWVTGRTAGELSATGFTDFDRLLLHTAQNADLRLTVTESGTLESAGSADVLSEVEGQVAIIR